MSRVKGRLALRDIEFDPQAMNYLLAELLIFDLWAVLKVRQILNVLKKMLPPVLEATCLMSLGAGLLFVYTFKGVAFDVLKCNEIVRTKENSVLLTYRSPSFESFLKRELFDLRNRTLSLDIALQKMNAQLRDLGPRESVKDLEMADFASEASGGSIIATPSTETYYEPTDNQIALFGIPLLKPSYFTPRKVIQPWTQAGECWAFRGSHGKIEIELPYTAIITHVTMEHIPLSLSITGVIDSAPKEFLVFGKFRNKYITIDKFVYDINGPPSQTFPAKKEELRQVSFKRILLEVLSNWGNPEYTCIYRFKVHGKLSEDLSKRSSSNRKN